MNYHYFKYILIFFAFTYSASAQWSEVKQNQIDTFGNATIYYNADIVQFSFSVTGLGSTIDKAVQQADEKAARISQKLIAVGLKKENLQTSYFNSTENRNGKSWWTSSKDFAAKYDVIITLDSFKLLEPCIQVLSSEPVEHISNLHFSLKDDSLKQLAALRAAAEDAKRKAELIAATLGAKITRVLFVEDLSSFSSQTVDIRASRPPNYIFTGKQIPVQSRLRVYFELGYPGQKK